MKLSRVTAAFLVFLASVTMVVSQKTIFPEEAGDHVGEEKTVCGVAVDTNYVSGSRVQPTFINLDKPYPDHIFTVLIWGENRWRFEAPPETAFKGKRICVTGEIETYRGKPQIEITYAEQIEVEEGG